MQKKIESIKELFPVTMKDVSEILWTGRSKLEMLCSIKELSATHIVLQTNNDLPEVGTRGIVWLPYFRIFPAVISERTENTFTAQFEDLDAVMQKDLNYFLNARKTGVKKARPPFLVRSLVRIVYLIEQRLKDIERRTFAAEEFPWSLNFEKQYGSIRKEVEHIFKNVEVESIPQGLDRFPKAHSVLIAQQGKVEPNAQKLLPTISRLMEQVPSLANAELSILAPGAKLRVHKAANRCFLRMHLGVIVPEGDICLELEGERLQWKEGKVMIFDDFYPHTAWNKTDHTRVILMVDLFRPMSKWQEAIMRFAQRQLIPSIPKIPDEWLTWEHQE